METRKRKLPRTRRRRSRAATSDVLGVSARPDRPPRRWQTQYRHLRLLRDQLLRRKGDLARDALEEQPAFSTHMADAATDNFDRDFALGLLSSEQDALYEIDQALDRIRTGTYGICEFTGKPIEPNRLAAIPWARFTAAAERQLEKQGSVKSARLGPRHGVVKTDIGQAAEEEDDEI